MSHAKRKRGGLAVILGHVSGNLYCRDFDAPGAYEAWKAGHPDLAARPVDAEGSPVFASIPEMETFRVDLAAAGIDEVDERKRRVVLHSLRHSLATMLAASKVPMAVAQRVMRHRDIRLTAEVYCDEGLLPLAEAMASLPAITEAAEGHQTALATGTDGPITPGDGGGRNDCAKTVPDSTPEGAFRGTLAHRAGRSESPNSPRKQGSGAPTRDRGQTSKTPREERFRTRSRESGGRRGC